MNEIIQIISYLIIIGTYLGLVIPYYYYKNIQNYQTKFSIISYSLIILIFFSLLSYIVYQITQEQEISYIVTILFILILIDQIYLRYYVSFYYFNLSKEWNRIFKKDDPRIQFVIDLAFKNLCSSDLNDKNSAFQQLIQLSLNNEVYYRLIEMLQKEKKQEILNLYSILLCFMNKRRTDYSTFNLTYSLSFCSKTAVSTDSSLKSDKDSP
jgi:hypothetical protein